MTNRILKNFVAVFFWIAVTAVAAAVTITLATANYLATKAAFELLGFEMRPLRTDELIGWLFEALAPDATIAHLFALALTATMVLGFFLMFHLGGHLRDLCDDFSAYRAAEDRESAGIIAKRIAATVGLLILFALFLGIAAWWDLNLYRFRSVAGSLSIEDPSVAAPTIERFDLQMRKSGHLFAWTLASLGAWGYLALTLLTCLSLEFSIRKIGESTNGLLDACGAWYRSQVQGAAGELEDAEPAMESEDQIADDAQPLVENSSDSPEPSSEGEQTDEPSARPRPRSFWTRSRGESQASSAAPKSTAERAARTRPPRPEDTDLRDVIGGDEKVSVPAAMAAPDRYVVDVPTGQVWARPYWDELHAANDQSAPDSTEEAA